MGKGRRRKREGIGIHPREVPSNFSAVVAPMVCCQSSGLHLRSGGLGLLRSLLCHVYSLCDGKSYFPSLHVTVSLDPALPHCIVAVAIHCWVDLRGSYSRCCGSRVLILVSRRLDTTSWRSWSSENGLAYITGLCSDSIRPRRH